MPGRWEVGKAEHVTVGVGQNGVGYFLENAMVTITDVVLVDHTFRNCSGAGVGRTRLVSNDFEIHAFSKIPMMGAGLAA